MMNIKRLTKMQLQSGFGLIEIMIALGLGAIILLGVTEIATNNSQTRADLERTGRQIESAAYAIRLMERDLVNAGYWGEAGEQTAAVTLPPVCPGLDPDSDTAILELNNAMGYPVQGEDALGTSCVTPKTGTDFLAVRRANSCALGDTGCELAASNFHLQVNACFDPDDSSAPLPGVITIDSDLTNLEATTRDCSTAAPAYRLLSRVYFVNDDDELVRAELSGSGATDYSEASLVDGVEAMRMEYGVDTDGDGQVDLHTDAPIGTQWANVAMARISLVVRSSEASPGFSDNKVYSVAGAAYTVPTAYQTHRREVYTRTVGLRNIAGRREVQ